MWEGLVGGGQTPVPPTRMGVDHPLGLGYSQTVLLLSGEAQQAVEHRRAAEAEREQRDGPLAWAGAVARHGGGGVKK